MRKKIKNEIKEMVANVDWANVAPDNDNNNTMAYLFPTEVPSNRVGVAKAVLTCRPDSHPFPERTLLLHQPVKVGRAVAKIKAAPDNAIFDCKVLSRHHASLWYNNGHFYLQDTKSSNGTFVNNHRLSEGCKESASYEVCSGDIVQFGVDVLENSCSVTHGCIVATLRLYLPDGKEAKASQSTIVKSPTHVEDLCVLNNIIQEAVQREQLLEAKLRSLHMVVENCSGALGQAWQALCSEERLVARVTFLERRLAATQQQPPTDVQQLIDDKHQYEVNATEALRLAQEDKLKLLNQLGTIQWSICSSEEECAVLRGHVDRAHQDLQELGEKRSEVEKELTDSKEALQEAKRQIAHYKVILISDIIGYKDEDSMDVLQNHSTENGYGEDVVEKKLSSTENSENIALIWEKLSKADQKETSLSEAIKGLSENIKVGSKFKIPNHVKELEVKLYSLKNELWKLENNKSEDKANDNSAPQPHPTAIDPETESENKTNSDYNSSDSDSSKMSTIIGDEEQNHQDVSLQETKEDIENQNETVLESSKIFDKLDEEETKEMKTKLLREKISEITEQLDSAYDNGLALKLVLLQKELAFAEGHIASLTKELEATTNKLKQSLCEVTQLNQIKEQLSTEVYDLKTNFSMKAEECSKLEMMLSQSPVEEREKTDEDETSKYKEEVTQLQKKLEELLKSEADGSEEIERLNSRLLELQKELQERSLSSNVQESTARIESLKQQLESKQKEVEDLNKQVFVLIEMEVCLEEKVNALTSEMSVLMQEKEQRNVADKMTEVVDLEYNTLSLRQKSRSPSVIPSSLKAANYLYDNASSLLSGDDDPSISTISIDPKRLAELEEELVVTKEKYALISADNLQLSARLQGLKKDQPRKPSVDMLVYVLPVAAMLIYILMYQYIS